MGPIRKAALLAGAAAALLMAGAGVASADSSAYGAAYGSPGVLSGNLVQAPIDVPINACGNSLNLIGLLNPSYGNRCSNGDGNQSGDNGGQYQGAGNHDGWNHAGQNTMWDHHTWSDQGGWNHDGNHCDEH